MLQTEPADSYFDFAFCSPNSNYAKTNKQVKKKKKKNLTNKQQIFSINQEFIHQHSFFFSSETQKIWKARISILVLLQSFAVIETMYLHKVMFSQ